MCFHPCALTLIANPFSCLAKRRSSLSRFFHNDLIFLLGCTLRTWFTRVDIFIFIFFKFYSHQNPNLLLIQPENSNNISNTRNTYNNVTNEKHKISQWVENNKLQWIILIYWFRGEIFLQFKYYTLRKKHSFLQVTN